MSAPRLSICLVAAGMSAKNARLQPWRYLGEVAEELALHGHDVTAVSDCPPIPARSYRGFRVPSVRSYAWQTQSPVEMAVKRLHPDVLLVHIGLTSLLHQRLGWWGNIPAIGILTSPIYSFTELYRLGIGKLWRGRSLGAIALLGSLVPRWLLRHRLQRSGLHGLVVQTHTTYLRLVEERLWSGEIAVIPPGVDTFWRPPSVEEKARRRMELGFSSDDVVAVYFGSPASLRGVPLLLRATLLARRTLPGLKLLLLIRLREDEPRRDFLYLKHMLETNHEGDFARLVSNVLATEELVSYVAACDLAALPFEIVPSDAPLTPLEVRALGMPLVTTCLACLPELAQGGPYALARPGDAGSLAQALIHAATELRQCNLAPPDPRPWSAVGQEWEQLLEAL